MSRRPADDAAEALLEAGRSQPALSYDVELGLARHQRIRGDAPMPEWASASTTAAVSAPMVIKTLVSAVLVGALGVAAWQARSRPEPSAGGAERSPAGAESTRAVPPGEGEGAASEAWRAPTPILAPLPDQRVDRDDAARRAVRADAPGRTTRLQRARKQPASVRAAHAAAPRAEGAPASPARAEPAIRPEVTAAPEREPADAARSARPEPRPRAQAPDDLAEMQQVAAAERLLERSPARALALVREGDQRFARGYFQQERAYIAIMALIRLGRIEEARARAERFARRFPALPYGARIRSALEAQQAAASDAGPR